MPVSGYPIRSYTSGIQISHYERLWNELSKIPDNKITKKEFIKLLNLNTVDDYPTIMRILFPSTAGIVNKR